MACVFILTEYGKKNTRKIIDKTCGGGHVRGSSLSIVICPPFGTERKCHSDTHRDTNTLEQAVCTVVVFGGMFLTHNTTVI